MAIKREIKSKAWRQILKGIQLKRSGVDNKSDRSDSRAWKGWLVSAFRAEKVGGGKEGNNELSLKNA